MPWTLNASGQADDEQRERELVERLRSLMQEIDADTATISTQFSGEQVDLTQR